MLASTAAFVAACGPHVLIDLNEPGVGGEQWCRWQTFHLDPIERLVDGGSSVETWEARLGVDTLEGRWSHVAALAPSASDVTLGRRGLLIGFDVGDRVAVEGSAEGLLLSELGLDLGGRGRVEQERTVETLLGGTRRSFPSHLLEFGSAVPLCGQRRRGERAPCSRPSAATPRPGPGTCARPR